eukprot:SM000158S02025  [mRNA]  locus=s158:136156:137767:- [translate_table: standard]
MSSPAEWYQSLPPVTRAYGTVLVLGAAAAYLGVLDPRLIYLDSRLLFSKFQIWRAATTYLFVGSFSFRFAHMLLLIVQYMLKLEQTTFQGRTADFVYMLLFGMATTLARTPSSSLFDLLPASGTRFVLALAIPMLNMGFMASVLIYMLVYIWSRMFANSEVSIMGLVTIKGFYIPWANTAIDLMYGISPVAGLMGIGVGHLYYFLTSILPLQTGRNILKTPLWVYPPSTRNTVALSAARWGVAGPQQPPTVPASVRVTPGEAAPQQPSTQSRATFRGRSYRLDRD